MMSTRLLVLDRPLKQLLVKENMKRAVQLLIDNGCNINHVDGIERTLLTAACERRHKTITQLLIDKGCKPALFYETHTSDSYLFFRKGEDR